MLELHIYNNYNGKLFSDHFSHLSMHCSEYAEGVEMKLFYKSVEMGIVKIEVARTIPFSRLSDAISYLNMGKPVQYQAEELNRKYNAGKTLDPDAKVTHIICGYISRNIESQSPLIKDWWNSKPENQLS